jgi:hypothetical protein
LTRSPLFSLGAMTAVHSATHQKKKLEAACTMQCGEGKKKVTERMLHTTVQQHLLKLDVVGALINFGVILIYIHAHVIYFIYFWLQITNRIKHISITISIFN